MKDLSTEKYADAARGPYRAVANPMTPYCQLVDADGNSLGKICGRSSKDETTAILFADAPDLLADRDRWKNTADSLDKEVVSLRKTVAELSQRPTEWAYEQACRSLERWKRLSDRRHELLLSLEWCGRQQDDDEDYCAACMSCDGEKHSPECAIALAIAESSRAANGVTSDAIRKEPA